MQLFILAGTFIFGGSYLVNKDLENDRLDLFTDEPIVIYKGCDCPKRKAFKPSIKERKWENTNIRTKETKGSRYIET